jgi:alanyl-tRNA synthetase
MRLASGVAATEFLGYTLPASQAMVTALIADGNPVESAAAGTSVQMVLDQTPFYAESGGQIGDRGYLSGEDVLVRIEDVKKESNLLCPLRSHRTRYIRARNACNRSN